MIVFCWCNSDCLVLFLFQWRWLYVPLQLGPDGCRNCSLCCWWRVVHGGLSTGASPGEQSISEGLLFHLSLWNPIHILPLPFTSLVVSILNVPSSLPI